MLIIQYTSLVFILKTNVTIVVNFYPTCHKIITKSTSVYAWLTIQPILINLKNNDVILIKVMNFQGHNIFIHFCGFS